MVQEYCSQCGASTLTSCQQCHAPIRGYHNIPGVISLGGGYERPSFCYRCGKAYPWTAESLEAARQLALEEERLTTEEREQLAQSLNDLIVDTPRTQLAAARFKKLLTKASSETASAMRDIVVDIASETARKILFPGP
jgi:hypothetical protein